MPTLTCPGCGAVVSFERANKYGSIRCQVRCQECDQWFRLDSFQPAALDEAALADPPSGARFERLANGFTVAVSGRTCDALLIFFGLPCFALFAGIALGRLNAWSAAAMILLLGGAGTAAWMGELRITRHGDRLTIFRGVGKIGFRSMYLWSGFRSAYEVVYPAGVAFPDGGSYADDAYVVLSGSRRVTFGSWVTEERRRYLLAALRVTLRAKEDESAPDGR
jgi:hypothetical protein